MYDKLAIKAVIPHREPFLLIDEIIEFKPKESCTAVKYVSGDEDFFKGHFPAFPVMPGVLILEGMAQAGTFALMISEEYKDKMILFAGADKVKFRKSVYPGNKLVLKCEVSKLKRNYGQAKAYGYVNEELVCEATIRFIVG